MTKKRNEVKPINFLHSRMAMVLELKKNRDKIINMEIANVIFNLNLKMARIFMDFFIYSERVGLVDPPIIIKQLVAPQLSVDVKFVNCNILLLNSDSTNAVGLFGKFNFMYARHSYTEKDLFEDEKQLKEGEESEKEMSKWIFDSSEMHVLMGQTKYFFNIQTEKKKLTQIFLPFSIFITSNNVLIKVKKNKETDYL
mmetsp:Transcript_23548/g.20454  ORF Transcript_23548/g.20454 Transcript_23548/m.20454 type:complete len:197 (-) Transcript_23548:1426-2016(-)